MLYLIFNQINQLINHLISNKITTFSSSLRQYLTILNFWDPRIFYWTETDKGPTFAIVEFQQVWNVHVGLTHKDIAPQLALVHHLQMDLTARTDIPGVKGI